MEDAVITKHQEIQAYYGSELSGTDDLKTNACCTLTAPPKHIQEAMNLVHEEVHARYYGCGLIIPHELNGLRILDLGSGSGRDCYIAGKLVGEHGSVVGVDMTDSQLAVARKHIEYHREVFGYSKANVSFLKGNIEALDELGLEPESFDLIISNCVINLAVDKDRVLRDAFALLKPGGELYFSDIYSDRRIPENLRKDPILWGECLSGAMYWNDFLETAIRAGFSDPRAVENNPVTVNNPELEAKTGDIQFFSVTYRLFKIAGLERSCEDYGQAVRYKGSLSESPNKFLLDDHHLFPKGKIMLVCGNTWKMLQDTRFCKHFDFYGDFDTHYGIFEGCGGAMPFTSRVNNTTDNTGSCC